jgi:hypothetical protein
MLPLLTGAVSGIAKGAVKGAAKNKAKSFVTGRGKKKDPTLRKGDKTYNKGVETATTVSNPKVKKVASIKMSKLSIPTGKIKITPKSKKVSYESLNKTLNNITKVTNSLVKSSEAELNYIKQKNEFERKKSEAKRAKKREEKLEKKKRGFSIPSIGMIPSVKGTGEIFNFLSNILLGGLALFLLNNLPAIENLFTTLKDNFLNPFKFIKSVIVGLGTVFSKPIASTLGGLFNGVRLVTRKVLNFIGPLTNKVKRSVVRLGKGLKNFVLNIINKAKNVVTRGVVGGAGAAAGAKPRTLNQLKSQSRSASQSTIRQSSAARNFYSRKGFKRLSGISKIFKRIPLIGALLSIGIDLALGESIDRTVVGAIGGGLGAWIGGGIGSLVFPFAGTAAGAILGSMIGDWAAKALYEKVKSGFDQIDPLSDVSSIDSMTWRNIFGVDEPWTPPEDSEIGTTYQGQPTGSGSGSSTTGLNITGAKTTYYDPSLGGINASGYKTPEGLPATSTGEGYKPEVFSAAAFPPLLKMLPSNMTVPARNFPGGRTLKKPFTVIVTNSQGKSAVVRVNDVGPGVSGHSSNHMLDFSVAAKNYLGTGQGFTIQMAEPGSKPGPLKDGQITPQQQTPQVRPSPTQTSPGENDPKTQFHDKGKDGRGDGPQVGASVRPSAESEQEMGGLLPSGVDFNPARGDAPGSMAEGVSRRASYEQQAFGSPTIMLPPQTQPMMSGGGGGGMSMTGSPSTSQILNSYYKAQLMGFLYKQG